MTLNLPISKKTLAVSFVFLNTFFLCVSSVAQEYLPAPPLTKENKQPLLTLSTAVERVLKIHPALLGAQERVGTANLQLDSAQYQRFPSLSVDAGRISGSRTSNAGNQTTVSLTQPVYSFGRITGAIDAASQRLESAKYAVSEAQLQLLDQANVAFFEVLRTRDRASAAHENLTTHTRLCETIERRADGGIGSESDMILAKTRLGQARNELAVAQSQSRKAVSTLSNLLGLGVGSLSMPALLKVRFFSESDFVEATLNVSPALRRMALDAVALRSEAKSLEAATLPQFVVRAERVESNVPSPYSDSRLIAAVQYTPGAGLSAFSNAQAAQSKALAAEKDMDRTKQDLRDRASSLFSDMVLANDQLGYLEKLKASNASLVDSLFRQFQAGKRSWLDVLNAQREYNQSELTYIDTFYNAQSSIRRADLLLGQIPIRLKEEAAITP